MSWACLDDGFADHPKVLGLTDAAFRLHVSAMCWAARRGTDGLILQRDLRVLGGMLQQAADPADLVAAGLWEPCATGWTIHDWLKFNKPAAEIAKKREDDKARQQAWRDQQKEKRRENSERNALRNGERTSARNSERSAAPSHPIPSHPSDSYESDLLPKSPRGNDGDLPAKVKVDPEDLGINAWNAIQEAAGGPQALGLDRCYGSDVSCWLEDSRLSAWVLTWKRLRALTSPHTLADCERLGHWIAAGGAGKLTPWQVLAKPGNHANAAGWFTSALRWDGVSDPSQFGSTRAPAEPPRSGYPAHEKLVPTPLQLEARRLRRERDARAAAQQHEGDHATTNPSE